MKNLRSDSKVCAADEARSLEPYGVLDPNPRFSHLLRFLTIPPFPAHLVERLLNNVVALSERQANIALQVWVVKRILWSLVLIVVLSFAILFGAGIGWMTFNITFLLAVLAAIAGLATGGLRVVGNFLCGQNRAFANAT